MADFCWDCTEKVLGIDPTLNDLKGLCNDGEYFDVLCEGCGQIYVDHNGKRIHESFSQSEMLNITQINPERLN